MSEWFRALLAYCIQYPVVAVRDANASAGKSLFGMSRAFILLPGDFLLTHPRSECDPASAHASVRSCVSELMRQCAHARTFAHSKPIVLKGACMIISEGSPH